jgi:hypothetical protein
MKLDLSSNLRTPTARISFVPSDRFTRDSYVKAVIFIRRIRVPTDQGQIFSLNGGPQKRSEFIFFFDCNAGLSWCWRSPAVLARQMSRNATYQELPKNPLNQTVLGFV